MGENGSRGKDWLRARGYHLCLTDTIVKGFNYHVFKFIVTLIMFILPLYLHVDQNPMYPRFSVNGDTGDSLSWLYEDLSLLF